MMNTMRIPVILTLFMGLFLISCQKESNVELPEDGSSQEMLNIDISEAEAYYLAAASRENENTEASGTFRHRDMCVKAVFPLTLEFPNGNTMEINSFRELRKALLRWRNTGNRSLPFIQFPHEVELPDGSIVTVENREELRRILLQCLKDTRPTLENCFKIVFPLEVELGDGNTQTVNSQEELTRLIRAWAKNNRDSLERPEIVFPIEIVLHDGTMDTLESNRELLALQKRCLPKVDRCFQWVFPLKLELPNGRVVEVNSNEELRRLMMHYRQNNTGDRAPSILFPQRVQLENGRVIVLNNLRELKRLQRSCIIKQSRDRSN